MLSAFGCVAAAHGQCPMEWVPGFHAPGVSDLDAAVLALIVHDDGSGPAVYAAGRFESAGESLQRGIARWDGTRWWPVGDWPHGGMGEFCVYDDGSGPALYGTRDGVHKWDGSEWSEVGHMVSVYALCVYDDGNGPALYAAGSFRSIDYGEVEADSIAKWDGTSWQPVGDGIGAHEIDPYVDALCVYDDGTGPALYAAGSFREAGNVDCWNIAKWDGVAWSPLGSGTNREVNALAVYDPPGPQGAGLYATGRFTDADWIPANRIARWDADGWSTLGVGIDDPNIHRYGFSLCTFDDGSGPALYVGGDFEQAGGQPAACLARWDGSTWSGVVSSACADESRPAVMALKVLDLPQDNAGPRLCIGGTFTALGDTALNRVAWWDGETFSSLGTGHGMSYWVRALCVYDDGAGPAVYAGGQFTNAGSVLANRVAKWDGAAWSALGAGTNREIYALGVFDPPDPAVGPGLYVGGEFYEVDGIPTENIARWDGTGWSTLGSGIRGRVLACTTFDDGSGPALYVGGSRAEEWGEGFVANRVAKWDGTTWSALGGGIDDPDWDESVSALCWFDPPGSEGPALYAGGNFNEVGGSPAWSIAKWDGETWSDVDYGVWHSGSRWGLVLALAVFDDGSGPALYVAGDFDTAGGVNAQCFAKWDGTSWAPVQLEGCTFAAPNSLQVFDDGTGPALYMGGGFRFADGSEHIGVLRWDGTTAVPLGGNTYWGPQEIVVVSEATGPTVYAGGMMFWAGEQASTHIAKLACPPGFRRGDLNCDGVVDQFDIDPFVVALVNAAAYEVAYPECYVEAADCNADGAVNAFDIDPFVGLLLGG